MTTTVKKKKQEEKPTMATKSKKKSKVTLFWEKYPEGIFEIMDMKAILK